ncbi:MAG: LD-carboxypeptidase [Eubacterium sp.]|nr:LD-carboxypeptidase [Eubacterium sp.]
MRFPKSIKPGDTIGFVAPAFGCAIEPYQSAFLHAIRRFHEKSFATNLGPNCMADQGIGISNTPEKCAAELMNMYLNPSADVLLSCGGGELMCQVMSHMDFSQLAAAKPKWFMGYSDNSNFSFLLTTLADTASIYGPNAPAFGMEPWDPSIQDAFDLLQGKKTEFTNYPKWEKESLKDEEHPLEPYNLTEPFRMVSNRPGEKVEMEGRLIGGCLDVIDRLVGTRFDRVVEFAHRYEEDGLIWYLESCELNVMDIRRALWHMKEADWFTNVKGFLIGRPMVFDQPMMGLDQYQAVTGILDEFNVPILMDLDIGHLSPRMPLVNGAMTKVVAGENQIKISMDLER